MANYVIPIFIVVVLIISIIKKINAYECFVSGARQAIDLCISTFPYLVAIFAVVELLAISGVSAVLANLAAPIFNLFGIPSELTEFLILRPFTGSGSLGMLSNLFSIYGPDSYISRCASIIMSCSETTFYVVAVYFSTTKIKKLKYTIPVCLLSAFLGAALACLFCRIFI
jgi:spore maturation protein B